MKNLIYNQVVVEVNKDEVRVQGADIFTDKPYITENIFKKDLILWLGGGEAVQCCMGYLSLDDREFLITGLVPDEHMDIYREEEEEEEEVEIIIID